ncbi:SDR family NAD(P)-dependent oxidoreductase [Nonomuraea dietziae]|uniref:SDR family NAD(P)-dependent oxidoreductase n=1 Tax=Nonomuraea dietziae TaxID=65515 RepID=UPI0031D9C95C
MDTELRDRVVLVTGASSGIGAATARAFGREGARVAITYRSSRDKAEKVAAEVEAAGGQAYVVRLDLEDLPSVARAVEAVAGHWGDVEVLVANAVRWGGDAPPEPGVRFEDVPLKEWEAMINANLVGAAASVSAVLPGMRAKGWGRIVLISSGVAEEGLPGPGPYGTAKSGLYGLARSLAWNGGRDGILVNVVAPRLHPDREPPARPGVRRRGADRRDAHPQALRRRRRGQDRGVPGLGRQRQSDGRADQGRLLRRARSAPRRLARGRGGQASEWAMRSATASASIWCPVSWQRFSW